MISSRSCDAVWPFAQQATVNHLENLVVTVPSQFKTQGVFQCSHCCQHQRKHGWKNSAWFTSSLFFAVNFYFQTTLAQEDTNQSRRMLHACYLWCFGTQVCSFFSRFNSWRRWRSINAVKLTISLEIRTLMDFFDRLSSNNHIKKKGGFSFRPCREINDLFVNMTNFEIHHWIHQPKRTSRCSLTRWLLEVAWWHARPGLGDFGGFQLWRFDPHIRLGPPQKS